MEPAPAFPPIWVMILPDPWVSHPVSPSRPYTSPQFPPHSTTLSSNLLLQPWQLKHMFSSLPELKLGDGEREEKGINEGRRESRGGKGSRGEWWIFLWSVLITSSQPGGEDTATQHSEGSLKQHLFWVRRGFNDLLYLAATFLFHHAYLRSMTGCIIVSKKINKKI